MAETVETIQLVIRADDKESKKALSDLKRSLGQASDQADKSEKSFLGLDKSVLKAAAGFASLGAVISLGRQFAELQIDAEKALTKVATLSDFTAQELDQMRQGTIELQRQFGISFTAISEARFDVVSAGFRDIAQANEILAGAFKLSQANATSVEAATSTLTSIMSAFGRTADDTSRTMDELTAIAQNSKTNLEGLAGALSKLAPTAVDAGQTLATAGAALDVLTLAGISADESATAVGAAMRTLVTPATQKALEDAGVQIKDLETGAVRPLFEIIEDLKQFTPEAIKTLIPSEEAQRGFSVLINNVDSFREKANFIASEDALGGTLRAASKTADTLDTKINILSETFNSLFQEGTFFGDQLKISIEGLTGELLFLRRVVGLGADEFEESADRNTKSQQRVLDLQKQVALVTGQIEGVERNLNATFASTGETRQRQLDFQAEKQQLLIGLTKQLESAEKDLANERALAEQGRIPLVPTEGLIGPTAPVKKEDKKGTEDLSAEVDKRTKLREKEAREAAKILRDQERERREIQREEERRQKERAALFESVAQLEADAFLATATEREKIIFEETQKETKLREEAMTKFGDGLINITELTDTLTASEDRLNDALARRGVGEDTQENFLAMLELAQATNEEFSTMSFLIEQIGEQNEIFEVFGETATIAFEAVASASQALGSALVDQAIAGDFSAKALGKAAQAAAQQVLKAEAAQAAGKAIIQVAEGTAALAASLFFPPAAQAAALHFAAAAKFAAVAGVATGLAKAVGGGGSAGGSLGGGQGEDVVSAERRRRRRDLDDERGGGGPTIVNNIRVVGSIGRAETDIIADVNASALRRQFDNQQINVNNGTISGQ